MSRRSRRRGRTGGGWLGKALIGLIIAGLVSAGVLYAVVRGYLHSDEFRQFLSAKASKMARVDGRFAPFRWDGLAVNSPSFEATGQGLVRELRLEGLHTEVGVGGLTRSVWEIKGSRIQRVELSLDARDLEATGDFKNTVISEPEKPHGWLPTRVELQGVEVGEVVVTALLKQGPLNVSGVRMRMEPGEVRSSYRIEAADGVIRAPLPFVPELRLKHAKLRWHDGDAFLSSVTGSIHDDGRFTASGEWNSGSGVYSVEGDVSGVKCEEVFNENWAKRFTGWIDTDFTVENRSGPVSARGRLAIRDGVLTALPMLDALAAYSDTRRFRTLSLSEARTDWRWKQDDLFLSNLVLASEGLIRLEGSLRVAGGNLDGLFRLGLAPGTLGSIPGAETDVFMPGERGLVWAPLRITGTLDDPKEDLTDRLIAAAGMRMFDVIPETGEKVIKFSRSLIGGDPAKAVDEGVRIIEKGAGIVEGVGGVLDGILGNGRKKPDNKEEP